MNIATLSIFFCASNAIRKKCGITRMTIKIVLGREKRRVKSNISKKHALLKHNNREVIVNNDETIWSKIDKAITKKVKCWVKLQIAETNKFDNKR